MNLVGEGLFGGIEIDFAGEVGEVGLLGADGLGEGDRVVDVHVGGVGGVFEAVDDEGIDVFEEGGGFRGDCFAIGDIGDAAVGVIAFEEEADCFDFAVVDGERRDRGITEGEGAGDDVGIGFEVTAVSVLAVEGELEGAFEAFHGEGGGVDGEEAIVFEGESSEVVEAHDVVGMGVCDEDRVDGLDAFAEALLPEVGTGIDDPGGFGGLDVDGGAEAFVARFVGLADGAMAPDDGDADGGAGAEKSE